MAYDFDGTNDYLEVGSAIATMPLTMACWFKPDDATTTKILMSLSTQAGTGRLQLVNAGAIGGKLQAGAVGSITGDSIGTTNSYSAGVWSLAIAVFSSASSRAIYLNGPSGNSSSVNVGSLTPDRTNIGARWVSGAISLPFAGAIAEPAIWSVALGVEDRRSLWAGMSPKGIQPKYLVSHPSLVRGFVDVKGNVWTAAGSPQVVDHPRIYYPSP